MLVIYNDVYSDISGFEFINLNQLNKILKVYCVKKKNGGFKTKGNFWLYLEDIPLTPLKGGMDFFCLWVCLQGEVVFESYSDLYRESNN